MSNRKVFIFLKYGKYEYMKKLFDDGDVYLQRWKAFKDIEHSEIGDRNEGVAHTWPSSQVKLHVDGHEIEGMIGALRYEDNSDYNPFIYCLYCFTSDCIVDGEPYIDSRCLDFGSHAVVITDLQGFISKFRCALGKNDENNVNYRLVDYVNAEEYLGSMGPFRKYDDFRHQSEFRFVIDVDRQDDTLLLRLGSLKDVALLVTADEVIDLIEVANTA